MLGASERSRSQQQGKGEGQSSWSCFSSFFVVVSFAREACWVEFERKSASSDLYIDGSARADVFPLTCLREKPSRSFATLSKITTRRSLVRPNLSLPLPLPLFPVLTRPLPLISTIQNPSSPLPTPSDSAESAGTSVDPSPILSNPPQQLPRPLRFLWEFSSSAVTLTAWPTLSLTSVDISAEVVRV